MTFGLRRLAPAFGLVVALSGCGTGGGLTEGASSSIAASRGTSLPVLSEGTVTPGTYVVLPPDVGWAECMESVECPAAPAHAETMQLEITVPSGWAWSGGITLAPPGSAEAPDGAGLAIGWYARGLHSDPCRPVPHSIPDLLIGPTVEDFVDAVVAHPELEVTEPVDTELGGYSGQFLTLTAPSDISDCVDWRPWEHGIPAQGPDNLWKLWVIDVDGLRVIVHSEQFPGTSADDSAELQAMVESIRFLPTP